MSSAERQETCKVFYEMVKMGQTLLVFGPSIFFDTSIYWSVLARSSTKLYDAIFKYFHEPENIAMRDAWLNFEMDPSAHGPIQTPTSVHQASAIVPLRSLPTISAVEFLNSGPQDMV